MYLQNLQQDEIFVPSEMKSLKSLTQMESRRGLENAIISNGKIVNVVSNSYGHIPNQLFFKKAEEMLTDAQLNFHKRTINKNDRSFITDFIIDDKSQFTVKNAKDLILPMLRFKNSYDGSEKTSGHLGFYRKVCSNGLHVSQVEIEFSIKHSKNNTHLIMPRLKNLFDKFLTNEFYTITKNFDKMKEFKIIDIQEFVKAILHRTKLFRYECSDKNSAPSKKSREVIEILNYEALLLNEEPNLWLGYNAFNSVLHNVLKKSFGQQERLDKKLLMKSMLSHKINKGLSSTSNWMAKYITDGYTQTHSAHSPAIREKLHNGQRASLERSWTQSPISAFHSVNPSRHAGKEHYIPELKS